MDELGFDLRTDSALARRPSIARGRRSAALVCPHETGDDVPPGSMLPVEPVWSALARTLTLVALIVLATLGIFASLAGRNSTAPVLALRLKSELRFAAFDPAAERIYGVDQNDRLLRIDLQTASVDHWTRRPKTLALAVCPSGADLATGDAEGRLFVFNGATGEARLQIESPGDGVERGPVAVTTLAYHPNGRMLAVGTADGTIRVHEATDGSRLAEVRGDSQRITHLAYLPSGDALISASIDGVVCLRDGLTGQFVRTIRRGGGRVRSLVVHPDGRSLALGVLPNPGAGAPRVLLVDLSDRPRPPRALIQSGCDDVDFSPDGRVLVGCGSEGIIRYWDVATGDLHPEIQTNDAVINWVRLTGDGRRVVTVGVGASITTFDATAVHETH